MKNGKYDFTDEQMRTMSYYERRSFLIAELNSGLVRNEKQMIIDYRSKRNQSGIAAIEM